MDLANNNVFGLSFFRGSEQGDFLPDDIFHGVNFPGNQLHHGSHSFAQSLLNARLSCFVQIGKDIRLADVTANRFPEVIIRQPAAS